MTDREQLLDLYQACFPEDAPAFWEWVFERLYCPGNTLNIRENGQIVASLQMLPCSLRLNDQTFSAHYIYAASTLPEQQGRGLMAQLLKQAAEEGRKRGQDFSILITQEDSLLDYYARFGYEPRFLLGLGQPGVKAENTVIRTAGETDLAALNELYERAAAGLLHGERDSRHWALQLELFDQGATVLERDGQITAYAFADERGIVEAVGPDAASLAAHIQPEKPWRTVPGQNTRPMGSIKPLNEKVRTLMEQNRCYLNLMYN